MGKKRERDGTGEREKTSISILSLSRFLRRTPVEMFLRSYAWILLMFFSLFHLEDVTERRSDPIEVVCQFQMTFLFISFSRHFGFLH